MFYHQKNFQLKINTGSSFSNENKHGVFFFFAVLLYARQESEDSFQPVHIHPPTLAGLAKGVSFFLTSFICNIFDNKNVFVK